MRVEVYRNLNKNCFSVRALEGPEKGRVIEHVRSVAIKSPQFVVQPAGREKARREGYKNVHAFIRGELCSKTQEDFYRSHKDFTWGEAKYDPYVHDSWVNDFDKPLEKARIAVLEFYSGHSDVSYI